MATNKPFFVPQKEVDLINKFNEELIDDIVGQTVDIYKVSIDDTEANVYGEAVNGGSKTFTTAFRVNCLINFEEPTVDQDEFGTDVDTSIGMYFQRKSLEDSDFYPEPGDIVHWNQFYFEINGVTEPQLIAGHQGYRHDVTATAHRVRRSSLNIEERIM